MADPALLRRRVRANSGLVMPVDLYVEVPMLQQNGTLLKLILERLRPVYYKEGSYIFREGEPIDRMVFLTSGTVLKLRTINGQGTVLDYIESGDNLDEVNKNILDWGFKLDSPTYGLSNLPISESTLKTHTEVDGFHLRAKELMEVFRKAPSNIEEAGVYWTPWKVQIDHRQPAQGGGSTSST
ncbi:cyclic nucleotide-gated ion channel 1-like [Carya illinoinensis]|uniref:cyclic nucleotide-gated ion channel 1-like n=1 Tax=Carya illinoinensis TaxID=32201 RepID=UPI001C7218B2|nr:cyclic nucleotide-gated ion channel 1-like [Carya illinoinensis]